MEGSKLQQIWQNVTWFGVVWCLWKGQQLRRKNDEDYNRVRNELIFGNPDTEYKGLLDHRKERIKRGVMVEPLEQWRAENGVSGKEYDKFFDDDC